MTVIRFATDRDLGRIQDLDRRYSPVFAHRDAYADLCSGNTGLLQVAVRGSDPVGFAAFSSVLDEATLLNLVVAPEARRDGIGSKLLRSSWGELRLRQVVRVILELRESNAPARQLYRTLGFVEDGRRRAYYPTTRKGEREDAILMSLGLESVDACS